MTAKSVKRILLIEDNPGDCRLLREMLNENSTYNTDLTHVTAMSAAEAFLAERSADIVLLDLGLPDAQGLDAVRRAHLAAPRVPIVVLTGHDDEAMAAQSFQEGAQDYLIKGQIDSRALLRAIRYAIERKVMDEALFSERERAQVTLNSIGDAVASTDAKGNITFLNQVAEQMTGWTSREAVGRPRAEVVHILDAARRSSPEVSVIAHRSTDGALADCVLLRRDGTEVPVEESVSPIYDRQGLADGAVIVFRDVSAARAMALELSHSARHDFLTGLPNRMLLKDRIAQAIIVAPRHAKKVAVLFLDLDGFKHINDSLGHSIGDKLLQSIAARLVTCVRGADTVSRQGGDEFVVMLSEVERSEDAAVSAARILEAVAEAHTIDTHDLHVTASIGVSVYPDDGLDAETLVKHADTAMYQAKENGRQTYRFFRPTMNERAVERQTIEANLRRALERDEFALHYQPKVNLRTGEIVGAEALIRWVHPTGGPQSPGHFIPIAEACGLMQPIGNWVLREACRQTRAWHEDGLALSSMAVNVSAVEFRSEHFLKGVFSALDDTGLDAGSLELELTEGALMKNAESTGVTLQGLRSRGVHLAIDDFGTGYSSLSYLQKFPIDRLKIDRSFIRQIGKSGEDPRMIVAVLNIAHSLKLRVVAEGVETSAELAFLQSHQCEEAQGYYFSRPLPALQFARLLRTGLLATMATTRLKMQEMSEVAFTPSTLPNLLTTTSSPGWSSGRRP